MGDDGATPVAAPGASGESGATPPQSRKRARADSESGDLARVAEIVMVLSAMGQMRGGRDPTPTERALMAEAREKLARICESVELHRRKDLFTKEMAMAVVVDHGLNPPKDNIPRPPKLSIAEKVANTKRKMEEAKELAAQSSSHTSQLPLVNCGVKPEGRSPLFQVPQRFVTDKASSMPSGGLQTASSGAHIPPLASGTSLLKQSQLNEVQRSISPLKPSASPSASCSGVRLPEKTLVPSVQAMPATSASSVQENRIQHTTFKVEGAHGLTVFQPSAQSIREKDSKTYTIQTIPGNQHFVHQVPHVVNLHDSSVFSSHNEISKMVQRILPPKAFDQPNWTSPSTDYISKPLNCLVCNIMINDVESSLVCDACEKGVHMKCLFTYNQRVISKAEWHCSNCLTSSHGKPLPPKYGRVTRSIATSRSASSSGSVHTSLEKKAGNADTKANIYQKIISNVKPDILTSPHASIVGHSPTESSTVKKMTNTTAKQESDLSVTDRNNNVHKEAPPVHSNGRGDPDTISSSFPGINQHNLNTGLLPCQTEQQTNECSLQTKDDCRTVFPQDSGFTIGINPASQESNALQIFNKVEVPIDSNISSKCTDNELKDPSNVKTLVHEGDCDTRRENVDVSRETTSGNRDRDCGRCSIDVHNVEWVGDTIRAGVEMSFYQCCCVNGFIYKVKDDVLVSSNSGKVLPSKLQALWENHTSGTKWATVHHCYYPSDLPEIVSRPATPGNDEVYESNKVTTISLESISGPCQVLLPDEFKNESERRGQSGETSGDRNPIFLCRWVYDESNGVFQCISR